MEKVNRAAGFSNGMAERNVTDTLYDPRRGDRAIRTQRLRLDDTPGATEISIFAGLLLSFLNEWGVPSVRRPDCRATPDYLIPGRMRFPVRA